MWITTTRGFYSAVQHRDAPDDLLIRARAREDLERLCELPGTPEPDAIDNVQPADYPYRLRVSKARWTKQILPALMEEVTYDNFKNAVKARMPEPEGKRRADIYMRVWRAMLAVTPSDDPSRMHKVSYYDTEPLWEGPEREDDLAFDPDLDLHDPWGPLPRLGADGEAA